MKNKILIISPSGKLYGSESVLIDYLQNTRLKPDVLVPVNSDLEKKLSSITGTFKVISYEPAHLKLAYLKLFFTLLSGKYKTVYLNEAGHVKYLLLLAKYFRSIQFRIHVRLIEDTFIDRWSQVRNNFPSNIKIISISSFLSEMIVFPNIMVPDPFIFSDLTKLPVYDQKGIFNLGIIGRITLSKGIELLPWLLREIRCQGIDNRVKIHLYGEAGNDVPSSVMQEIDDNPIVVKHGYVKGAEYIYSNLHAVMHLSKIEPLGRIFFESVNAGLPFIGIKAGGIGEIAHQYGYEELMIIENSLEIMAKDLIEKWKLLSGNYEKYQADMMDMKIRMNEKMNITNYCHQIDQLLSIQNSA